MCTASPDGYVPFRLGDSEHCVPIIAGAEQRRGSGSILPRVTRVYLKGEQVVEVKPLVGMDEPDSASESSGGCLRLSVLFAHGWEL